LGKIKDARDQILMAAPLIRIPYIAFRQAVPGKATAAHIHIGPVSMRL
jgi:hypothetical protein